MTASSPYAPHSRNSYLRRRSSASLPGVVATQGGGRGAAVVAFFMFAFQFWKDVTNRETILEFFRRRPALTSWMQGLLGWHSSTRHTNAPIQHNSDGATTRFRENQDLIQSVLNYWFGQYTPEEAQKNLWMIANSSNELRQRVDREITERFAGLLIELSDTASNQRWKDWCGGEKGDESNPHGAAGKVAAIVVLDQFSRHILRHFETSGSTDTSITIPTKSHLDSMALKTAETFVRVHKDEIRCGMIPQSYYIFSLMPYRHASTIETVSFVQDSIEEAAKMSTQMEAMLGRFRKATNRRMAVLQDEARRTGPTDSNSSKNASDLQVEHTDEAILETFAFEADMKPAVNHPIHKTIVNFLNDQGIRAGKSGESNVAKAAVIVSLSGGVDSMVIASALANLKKNCDFNLLIIAVHIDYGNRPESGAEADFVRRYCEQLGIDFRLRRIDEVTRGVTARDDYERISRDLRYNCYREAIAFAQSQLDGHPVDSSQIGVMLGHHKGDLRENVLSNAHKGCGPLDLSGMTGVSRNDGVTIFRPLLPLEKTSVFDYAHTFGVPYFKDTTPHWSTRGKLRNKLIPLIEEVYGEGSLKNLSNLAIESDECRALLYKSMIGPFLDGVQRSAMGIMFETGPWKQQTLFFWKFVLRETLHSARLGMFSDKSVRSFLDRIQAKTLKTGWLQCRKDYAVYLEANGKVFVLYPSSFPFRKQDMYKVDNQEVIPYGKEKKIGPWVVTSEVVKGESATSENTRLAQKALASMEDLMKGKIEYYLKAPTFHENEEFVPRPLCFCRFVRASRPVAWKNTEQDRNLYLKVQETLPLLGNDEVAQKALADPTRHGCVHTSNGDSVTNPTALVRVYMRLEGAED